MLSSAPPPLPPRASLFDNPGMGDAMATHYEACACAANPQAYTWMAPLTYRPPVIASAIGEACLKTLYELVSSHSVCTRACG